MTPGFTKDISLLANQQSDIKPQIEGAVCLLTEEGHFTFRLEFVWQCMGRTKKLILSTLRDCTYYFIIACLCVKHLVHH